MANKISKSDENVLRELSQIFRFEGLPAFADGYVTQMENSAAKKRRKAIKQNLEQTFENGVSNTSKAMSNLISSGITCLQQGSRDMGYKLIRSALEAKGCNEKFISTVLKLIKKAPKLVLEVCWPSSETMSSSVIATWLPGWNDFNVNANQFKFAKQASIKTA